MKTNEVFYEELTDYKIRTLLQTNKKLEKTNLKKLDSNAKNDLIQFGKTIRELKEKFTFANQMLYRKFSFLESIIVDYRMVIEKLESLGTDAKNSDFNEAENLKILYKNIQSYLPWNENGDGDHPCARGHSGCAYGPFCTGKSNKPRTKRPRWRRSIENNFRSGGKPQGPRQKE